MKRLFVLPLLCWGLTFARAESWPPREFLSFSTSDPAAWEEARPRRSEARPLEAAEILKLSKAGVKEKTLVRMIRSRGALVSPRGDVLAGLKTQGVSDDVLEAISTHALAENRRVNVLVTLDVASPYSVENAPTFYLALYNEERGTQEDLVWGPLAKILDNKWKYDELVDEDDPLLPTKIRRIRMVVPLRSARHGKSSLRLLLTQRTGLRDLTTLKPEEQSRVVTIPFDYPAVSLDNRCELDVVLARDPLLPRGFTVTHQNLRTYWD